MVTPICTSCRRGRHLHDRHTGSLPGTIPGADAGCPNAVGQDACACPVRLPNIAMPCRCQCGHLHTRAATKEI